MLAIRELTEAEYRATMVSPMRRLEPGELPPVRLNLSSFVAAAIETQRLRATLADVAIHHVYVPSGDRHTHVVYYFGRRHAYLVVIVDNVAAQVFGYRMLDLAKEYGLE